MKLTPDERFVVTRDVCFSSSMVAFLHANGEIDLWERVLGWLKNQVWRGFGKRCCYKFIGDGWILLLDKDTDSQKLMDRLKSLSQGFSSKYKQLIRPKYTELNESEPDYNGLTFGIDPGILLRTRMINKAEYLGPALNIASRLQGQAKELVDGNAGGSLVASDAAYKHLQDAKGYEWQKRRAQLRNIGHLDVWICRL
jgi:hypothetical protein